MAEVSRHRELAHKALVLLVEQGRPVHKADLAFSLGLSRAEVDYYLICGAHAWLFDSCGRFVQPSVRGWFWLRRHAGEATPNLEVLPVRERRWPCTASRRGVYVGAPGSKVCGPLSPGSALLVAELVLLAGGDPDFACAQAEALRRAAEAAQGCQEPGLEELRDLMHRCVNAALLGPVAKGGCEVGEEVQADEAVTVRIAE